MWDKEKRSEFQWGIERQTFQFHTLMLYHWATGTPQWLRSITKFMYDMGLASSWGIRNRRLEVWLLMGLIFFSLPHAHDKMKKITFSNNLQSSSSNISFWKFRGYIGIAQWQIGRLLLWLKSNDLINCKMCSFINYQQQVLFPDLDILLVTLFTECWVS